MVHTNLLILVWMVGSSSDSLDHASRWYSVFRVRNCEHLCCYSELPRRWLQICCKCTSSGDGSTLYIWVHQIVTSFDDSFAFPLFGHQMYAKLGYGWGNSLLGFLALGLGVPFPILIYRVYRPLVSSKLIRIVWCETQKVRIWRN
jgi:hypothetical protein